MRLHLRAPTTLVKVVFFLIFWGISQSSFTEVFKCLDESTGKLTFTDQACPDNKPGAYQPVDSTNIDADSASQNTAAGTKSPRDGAQRKGNLRRVSRAKEAGNQPKTESAKN